MGSLFFCPFLKGAKALVLYYFIKKFSLIKFLKS